MERRTRPRVPLDTPFFITVRMENGDQCPAMLVDCGRGGVQLAFSPAEDRVGSLLSQELVLLDMPKGLGADPDGCAGVVTWVSPQRCGVRFDELLALTDQELTAVAKKL